MAAAPPSIRLHPDDDVVIALHQIEPGTRLNEENDIIVSRSIPAGHKIATRTIAEGEPVRRYSQIIFGCFL